jgi:hypothetical protein
MMSQDIHEYYQIVINVKEQNNSLTQNLAKLITTLPKEPF